MIYDFPCIYEDELLYSVLGRYHLTSGNKNVMRTMESIFDRLTVIPSTDIPCSIESICNKIPEELGYNSDFIISNCSIFPLYAPFLSKERRQECIHIIKHENGVGLKAKIGIIAGGLCKKKNIFYCPICSKFENDHYNETYIHRIHQVQGVYLCEKHNCKLIELKTNDLKRRRFCFIDIENGDDKAEYFEDILIQSKLLKITEEVKYILEHDLSTILDQTIVHQTYQKILFEKGYLTIKGKVRPSVLSSDFIDYYGNDFLKYLDSDINIANKSNWLKTFFFNTTRSIHPIRHILLIDFLCGSIEQFIRYEEKINFYPCLNKFCNDYKTDKNTTYILSTDRRTKMIVVNVKCEECGFSYARKNDKGIYEIGMVKNYGDVWANKIVDMLMSGMSLRAIGKEMNCCVNTIIKYAEKYGYSNLIKSKVKIKSSVIVNKPMLIKIEDCKNAILRFIEENPISTITNIKDNKTKEYSCLYVNDYEWLKNNLPKSQRGKNYINNRVDWEKRDKEILNELKNVYSNINIDDISIRITKTFLSKKIDNQSYIDKQLDKLPLCKEFIEGVVESVEEFQIKRVDKVCEALYLKNDKLTVSKIKKLAGLNKVSEVVGERINNNIKKYSSNFFRD